MKIAIVEDHLMMRDVLRKACRDEFGHEIVAEADTGAAAINAIRRSRPEIVLLDLHLPDLDGFSVLNAIRQTQADCRVLILSSYCDDYTVFQVEQAHVQGFIDKNSSTVAVLRDALAIVEKGGVYFSETFKKAKADRRNNPHAFDKLLTDREQTILGMIGNLLTDYEIAARLSISDQTVAKHRFNIMRKFDLRSTAELARYARDHGFNQPSGQRKPI